MIALKVESRRTLAELQSIQALRAIAATSVILVHIPFIGKGAFGVDIFFVISGFIMCYISSANSDNFLLKRVFRIVPLYWIGTFGVFVLALVMPSLLNSTRANVGNLVKSLFLVPYRREDGYLYPMLFLGWTLEYEMFFYFIFGLALIFFKKWVSLAASFTLIAIVVAGKLFHASSTIPKFYSNPLILEFVFGMAVFALWNRYRSAFANLSVAAALIISVGCYAYLYHVTSQVSYNDRIFLAGFPALIIVLCFLVLEGRFKFPTWLLIIGDASYSLYLFHPYIIQLVDKKILSLSVFTPFSLIVSVAAILACFVVAIISFRLIEKPSSQFLRRYLMSVHLQVPAHIPIGRY